MTSYTFLLIKNLIRYSYADSVYYGNYQQQNMQNTNLYNGQYFIPSELQGIISPLFCGMLKQLKGYTMMC